MRIQRTFWDWNSSSKIIAVCERTKGDPTPKRCLAVRVQREFLDDLGPAKVRLWTANVRRRLHWLMDLNDYPVHSVPEFCEMELISWGELWVDA